MPMGSESKVVLNNEMQTAKGDFKQFRSDIATLVSSLDSTMSTLFNGFKGQAADGLAEFYKKNITDFFAAGGTFDQYMSMFDKEGDGLLDSIESSLTGEKGLDPSLGDNNRKIGQSSDGE